MKCKWFQSILCLLLSAALCCGLTCLPVLAADIQDSNIPCPKCGQYAMVGEIREPTCTRSGGYYLTCQNCGMQMIRAGTPYYNALNKPALGHNYVNGVCTRCGASDPNYQTPPSVTPSVTPTPTPTVTPTPSVSPTPSTTPTSRPVSTPTPSSTPTSKPSTSPTPQPSPSVQPNHTHKWQYDTIAATCTQEGQSIRTCTICGTTEVLRTTSKANHRWTYQSTEPTCTEEGKSTRTCSVCGTVEVLATTPKLEHKYTSTITQQATTQQPGVRTYTCTLCGDTYTEAIPKLGSTTESPIQKDPNAKATASRNLGANAYSFYSAVPMKSYLYARSDGGVTRVEAVDGRVVIEAYDQNFQLLTSSIVSMELPLFGGFYAGSGYNFLVFGQENTSDSSSKEVLRVVKYSKDWERLGQASVTGANTHIPFEAGSLRCTEYNGMLYVHTCHTMFASSDGLNHQANLIFSVRESDMDITDSQYAVSSLYGGYVSHSFNQFVAVDQAGRLVTVNHGDAIPRGLIVQQYDLPAGGDTFVNLKVRSVQAMDFVKSSRNYNYTGAWVGGLEISSDRYLVALSSVKQLEDVELYKTHNVMLAVTTQDIPQSYQAQTGLTDLIQLTDYTEGGSSSAGVPQMVKLSNNRFLILWDLYKRNSYGSYASNNTIGYAFVDGHGQIQGQIRTASAALSDCQPILLGEQVVWYTTNDSLPTFYTIDVSSGTLSSSGGAQSSNNPGVGAFSDVPSSHWAYSYITQASQKGFVVGRPDGTFLPEANVTAAEFCTMLSQGFYAGSLSAAPAATQTWWAAYVQTAKDQGLLQGTRTLQQYNANGGRYGAEAEAPLTRYEMALMMYNFIQAKGITLPTQSAITAAQNSIQDWKSIPAQYQTAVAACYALELLHGRDTGAFDGTADMTRAQACVVLLGLDSQTE